MELDNTNYISAVHGLIFGCMIKLGKRLCLPFGGGVIRLLYWEGNLNLELYGNLINRK